MKPNPKLAVTFEAAGDSTPTKPILRKLQKAGVKCTFFLDGIWAKEHPNLVQQIAELGHELGNHGYRHPDWTELTDEEIRYDLRQTEELVHSLTGQNVKPWARPPYGAINQRVLSVLEESGYHAIYRDAVDGGHWPGETTSHSIYQRALQSATSGEVLVFHTNRSATAKILLEIIAALRGEGYSIGTLSDLGFVPSPRLKHHPDFEHLEIAPGYIRPRVAGPWQSINLLEMGALDNRSTNTHEEIVTLAGTTLSLVTGDGVQAMDWESSEADVWALVLSGAVRCEFASAEGRVLGYLVAREGDIFRCPAGWPFQLAADPQFARRWIAVLWRSQEDRAP